MEKGIFIHRTLMPVLVQALGGRMPEGITLPEDAAHIQGDSGGIKNQQELLEALAASGILKNDESGHTLPDDMAFIALNNVWKATHVLLCTATTAGGLEEEKPLQEQKNTGASKRMGFYLYEDSMTMVTWEPDGWRLLYLPTVKLAVGALADLLWQADGQGQTEDVEKAAGAGDDQTALKLLKEGGAIPPEKPDTIVTLEGFDQGNRAIRSLIYIQDGRGWLCEYDAAYVHGGWYERTDLINRAARWLIRAHREDILALMHKGGDKGDD